MGIFNILGTLLTMTQTAEYQDLEDINHYFRYEITDLTMMTDAIDVMLKCNFFVEDITIAIEIMDFTDIMDFAGITDAIITEIFKLSLQTLMYMDEGIVKTRILYMTILDMNTQIADIANELLDTLYRSIDVHIRLFYVSYQMGSFFKSKNI